MTRENPKRPGAAPSSPRAQSANGVMSHDLRLRDVMLEVAEQIGEHRSGSMFGCPAIYVAGRLACCVYASTLAFKVPASLAARFIEEGRGTWFQPYGKARMREWVAIEVSDRAARRDATTLMKAAFAHARTLPRKTGM